VRGDVSTLARRLLAALITIDVHSRDIVSDLLSKGTSSTDEFEWQMQLRYYWEDDDLIVRQVRSSLQAGSSAKSPRLWSFTWTVAAPRAVRLTVNIVVCPRAGCGHTTIWEEYRSAVTASTCNTTALGIPACCRALPISHTAGQGVLPVCLRIFGSSASSGSDTNDGPLLPHADRRTAPQAGRRPCRPSRWVVACSHSHLVVQLDHVTVTSQ
jgi:hypothetical protein